MATSTMEKPQIVSRDEWLAARENLLAKEKQLTRQRDALAAERRRMPWLAVEQQYGIVGHGGHLGESAAGPRADPPPPDVRGGFCGRL